MEQKSKRKKYNRDVDEPVFESDEYFAYIAEYTDGGFPCGITWEEASEIEKSDSQFGKAVGLTAYEKEERNDDVELPF